MLCRPCRCVCVDRLDDAEVGTDPEQRAADDGRDARHVEVELLVAGRLQQGVKHR